MPTVNGGIITGVLFEDLIFNNDNGQLVPGQNGPFALPANATMQIAAGAGTTSINVADDDPEFEDGFQETGLGIGNQSLVDTVVATAADGTTVTFTQGLILEVEFTLLATPQGGGDPITLLFVAVGPGENNGDLQLVIPTSPLDPGVTYDIEFVADGGGTPYLALVCFAEGTLIDTPNGQRAVETLTIGDPVSRVDGDAAILRWISSRTLSAAELAFFPQLRPVRIKAGAFGENGPDTDLLVSPQHRILIKNSKAKLMFGEDEVLAPAIALCDGDMIRQETPKDGVTFYHILFDAHEIVISNGLATESFFPGSTALDSLEASALEEFRTLFPELAEHGFSDSARPMLKPFEAKALFGSASAGQTA